MDLLQQFSNAAKASRRPLYALLAEALRLRTSFTRLGLTEYIDYQLYKDDLTWEQKKSFGGVRTQKVLEEILIDDYSRFLSLDKVTMYALLDGLGLSIPHVRATYRSLRPSSIPQLRRPDELEAYLSQPGNTPVYFKPSFGSYGRGNAYVAGVEGDRVLTGNGRSEALSKFVQTLDRGDSLGWILQEPLKCDARIAGLTGSEKISGVRIHTFLANNAVVPIKAIFKVNVGLRDTDNFEHGASGNMLAAVDIRTGRVCRAIAGIGFDQVENPRHPVSGREIVGFEIPHWRETLELVENGQKAFPGFLCPGWDIAICQDGPRILEVNAFGDIDLPQHAYRTAFIDDAFVSLLKSRHLDGLLNAQSDNSTKSPLNSRIGIRRHHWQW